MNTLRPGGLLTVALLTALLALAGGRCRASSTWTFLTPTTLGHSPLVITVHAAATTRGEQFTVMTRRRAGVAYHFLHPDAWLETGPFRPGQFGGRPHPAPVTLSKPAGESTMFRFTLPADRLTNVRLCFGFLGYDTGKQIMPSADFYWLLPADFVPTPTTDVRSPLIYRILHDAPTASAADPQDQGTWQIRPLEPGQRPAAPTTIFPSLSSPALLQWVQGLPPGTRLKYFWGSSNGPAILPQPLKSELDDFSRFCAQRHVYCEVLIDIY